MRRLKFSRVLILSFSLICLLGCRQGVKKNIRKPILTVIEKLGGNYAEILTSNFSSKFLAENLENFSKSELKLLAKQMQGNLELVSFIGKNPQTIKTWRILSKTDFSSKPSVIKYFDDLNFNKEINLISDKGIPKIISKNNKEVLAEISSNKIILAKTSNNPAGHLGNLAPNSIYKVGNVNYLIDASGRVKQLDKPLLRKSRSNINNLENNLLLPMDFGGSTLGLNKGLISENGFKKLFQEWNLALSKNKKVQDVSIIPIYKNTQSNIADGFNVSYVLNKKRVYGYFPNKYNKQCKDVLDEIKQPVIGKHVKTNINRKVPVFNLSKDVSLIENKLMYKGNEFGKIDPVNRVISMDRGKALNKEGLNPILSHPKLAKNYTYNVKDGNNLFKYKTNSNGDVSSIEADIMGKIRGERISKGAERTKTKQVKDEISSRNSNLNLSDEQHKKLSDEAGHFIGDVFGGIPEVINMFPQAFKLNRGGKWKNMEKAIRNVVDNGDKVNIKIKPIYDGLTKRPTELIYEYTINGKKVIKRFENVNYTKTEII